MLSRLVPISTSHRSTGAAAIAQRASITLGARPTALQRSIGGSPSPAQLLTIANSGNTPLTIPAGGISFTGANASQFSILYSPPLPLTLVPGASTAIYPAFNPQGISAGIETANIQISSNDPAHPSSLVAVRGLATTGTGGTNEPSLQQILNLYQIPDKLAKRTPIKPPSRFRQPRPTMKCKSRR